MPNNHTKTMEERIAILEAQFGRVVSDIESEKRTRSESHRTMIEELKSIDNRLRNIEWKVYIGIGIFVAIKLLASFLK